MKQATVAPQTKKKKCSMWGVDAKFKAEAEKKVTRSKAEMKQPDVKLRERGGVNMMYPHFYDPSVSSLIKVS